MPVQECDDVLGVIAAVETGSFPLPDSLIKPIHLRAKQPALVLIAIIRRSVKVPAFLDRRCGSS
jgi:hypothetical protein